MSDIIKGIFLGILLSIFVFVLPRTLIFACIGGLFFTNFPFPGKLLPPNNEQERRIRIQQCMANLPIVIIMGLFILIVLLLVIAIDSALFFDLSHSVYGIPRDF